jgi:hypothetical protein
MMIRKFTGAGREWPPQATWLVVIHHPEGRSKFDLFTDRDLARLAVPLNYRVIQ